MDLFDRLQNRSECIQNKSKSIELYIMVSWKHSSLGSSSVCSLSMSVRTSMCHYFDLHDLGFGCSKSKCRNLSFLYTNEIIQLWFSYLYTGCSLNIVFFSKILKCSRHLPFSVFPGVRKNNKAFRRTQYLMNTLYIERGGGEDKGRWR